MTNAERARIRQLRAWVAGRARLLGRPREEAEELVDTLIAAARKEGIHQGLKLAKKAFADTEPEMAEHYREEGRAEERERCCRVAGKRALFWAQNGSPSSPVAIARQQEAAHIAAALGLEEGGGDV